MDVIAALDIGGTKLAAGLVDLQGNMLCHDRAATRATATADGLLGDAVQLLSRVMEAARPGYSVLGIGIGCGGPMDKTTVSPLNIPAWRTFPLCRRVQDELGDRVAGVRGKRVVVDNDAKAMAIGEGWVGAARGADDFLGMVVSTGVGGGIVLDGRLLDGAEGNAGHVGHIVVVPDGEFCVCGARGCVEAEASGTSIARKAANRAQIGAIDPGPLLDAWRHRGESGTSVSDESGLTAVDVANAARAGDPAAIEIMDEAGTALGRGIASVAGLLDVRLAVVGGGVATGVGELIFAPMREEAGRRARIAHARSLSIVPAMLGSEAGIVGAAATFLAHAAGSVPRPEG